MPSMTDSAASAASAALSSSGTTSTRRSTVLVTTFDSSSPDRRRRCSSAPLGPVPPSPPGCVAGVGRGQLRAGGQRVGARRRRCRPRRSRRRRCRRPRPRTPRACRPTEPPRPPALSSISPWPSPTVPLSSVVARPRRWCRGSPGSVPVSAGERQLRQAARVRVGLRVARCRARRSARRPCCRRSAASGPRSDERRRRVSPGRRCRRCPCRRRWSGSPSPPARPSPGSRPARRLVGSSRGRLVAGGSSLAGSSARRLARVVGSSGRRLPGSARGPAPLWRGSSSGRLLGRPAARRAARRPRPGCGAASAPRTRLGRRARRAARSTHPPAARSRSSRRRQEPFRHGLRGPAPGDAGGGRGPR